MSAAGDAVWHRVLGPDDLPEGRVTTVTAGHRSLAMTHHDGRYGALDNRCPHQGGPLGEGSIENGWLRCPWHGWDYCPITGRAPGGHEDSGVATFAVDVREDGVWVAIPPEPPHVRTVSDLMVETMVAWGVTHVFGMVGHSNLGLADAIRRQVEDGGLTYVGIRHEGAAAFAASAFAKLTGRPAACLSIAGPGATNLLTGLWDAKVDRAPILALTGQVDLQVLGPGAFQEVVKYGMPITHVLLHNGELGKISKEQRAGMWDVWETGLRNPGFAAYAELCGAQGIRVTGRDALGPALEAALAHDGPSLVEVMQDRELV